MAFSRIDLLPLNNFEEGKKARDRWATEEGRLLSERITGLIRKGGGGEDFLQCDFETGNLGFLSGQWDLTGFQLLNESTAFPNDDNFESIDFSHARFWHSTFTGACFPLTTFNFARFYNVTFKRCLFHLANFYGCELQKCLFEECDFVEGNGFTNCDISETAFKNCFIAENISRSCRFDENVKVYSSKKN